VARKARVYQDPASGAFRVTYDPREIPEGGGSEHAPELGGQANQGPRPAPPPPPEDPQ